MQISYMHDGALYVKGALHNDLLDATDIELREVFNGVTFVTEDGERLSVCMRDSGFEVHYYGGNFEEKSFDLGWFRFVGGRVIPLDQPDQESIEEDEDRLDSERVDAWNLAELIVDDVVEENPLQDSRKVGSHPLMSEAYSKAEQKIDLITKVANWLLGENNG